jgi:hypothetical protein
MGNSSKRVGGDRRGNDRRTDTPEDYGGVERREGDRRTGTDRRS